MLYLYLRGTFYTSNMETKETRLSVVLSLKMHWFIIRHLRKSIRLFIGPIRLLVLDVVHNILVLDL